MVKHEIITQENGMEDDIYFSISGKEIASAVHAYDDRLPTLYISSAISADDMQEMRNEYPNFFSAEMATDCCKALSRAIVKGLSFEGSIIEVRDLTEAEAEYLFTTLK